VQSFSLMMLGFSSVGPIVKLLYIRDSSRMAGIAQERALRELNQEASRPFYWFLLIDIRGQRLPTPLIGSPAGFVVGKFVRTRSLTGGIYDAGSISVFSKISPRQFGHLADSSRM